MLAVSAPQLFQLGPTNAFTTEQRRELNNILTRVSQAVTNVIFGKLDDRPDPGVANRIFIQTDANGPHVFLDTGVFWYVVL